MMPKTTLNVPKPISSGAVITKALLRQFKKRQHSSAHMPTRTVESTRTLDPAEVAAFHRVVAAPVSDTVHPGYLHKLGFPLAMQLMTDPGFPLPLLGLVHVLNRFALHRPVRIGETVTTQVHIGQARKHRKGTEFDVEITGLIDGETVFDETATYLAIGKHLACAEAEREEQRTEFEVPSAPSAIWKLARSIGPAYAKVSGDYNPIHMNPLAAKAFGFPASIAHGMYTASRAFSATQGGWDAYTWQAQFAKPVILPARVGFGVFDGTAGGGRSFAVWDLKKGKPHVLGSVRPLSSSTDGAASDQG